MKKTLDQWLKHLETHHPIPIDLGLERIHSAAQQLNLIHFPNPVITVAGTNGKGSTIASIAACYQEAGYQVGVYTSPHLVRFNERIKINSEEIDNDRIVKAFELIQENTQVSLSYFEYTTLAALIIFQQANLDLMILEVGLGGRLDAVNVVEHDISVITTIDYDHQEWLGDTREAIAKEKTGIIRENQSVVIMETDVPSTLLEVVKERSAQAYFYEQDYSGKLVADLNPSIAISNLATAQQVTKLLQDKLPITQQQVLNALAHVEIPGRCQILQKCPWVILDVAHNAQSAQRLKQFIASLPKDGECHILFSALKDKDIDSLIKPLAEYASDWSVSSIDSPRAMDCGLIMQTIAKYSEKPCYHAKTLAQAYQQLLAKAKNNDMIVVYGSFFTVGEILQQTYENTQ